MFFIFPYKQNRAGLFETFNFSRYLVKKRFFDTFNHIKRSQSSSNMHSFHFDFLIGYKNSQNLSRQLSINRFFRIKLLTKPFTYQKYQKKYNGKRIAILSSTADRAQNSEIKQISRWGLILKYKLIKHCNRSSGGAAFHTTTSTLTGWNKFSCQTHRLNYCVMGTVEFKHKCSWFC